MSGKSRRSEEKKKSENNKKRKLQTDEDINDPKSKEKRPKSESQDFVPFFDQLPLEILHLIFRRFTFWELFDSVQLVNKKWLVQCWRAQQSIVVFPNFRPVTNAHILVVLRRAGTLPFLHSFACPYSDVSEVVLPTLIQTASRIASLHLQFHTLSPAFLLRFLPQLTHFTLEDKKNLISSKIVSHIAALTTLRSLNLQWNKTLSTKKTKFLISLSNLTELTLNSNLTWNAYPLLTMLSNLRALILNSFPYHRPLLSQVQGLTQLEMIHFHHTPLSDEENFSILTNFKKLTALTICHFFNVQFLKVLPSLTNLQCLELLQLHSANLSVINQLTTLTRLYLPNTYLAVKKKIALPQLRSLSISTTHQYPLRWVSTLRYLTELNVFLHGKAVLKPQSRISQVRFLSHLKSLSFRIPRYNPSCTLDVKFLEIINAMTHLTSFALELYDPIVEGDLNKITTLTHLMSITNQNELLHLFYHSSDGPHDVVTISSDSENSSSSSSDSWNSSSSSHNFFDWL